MSAPASVVRPQSTAAWLATALIALVVYASLYPFSGWRWPGYASASQVLALPLPPWRDPFDVWSNFVGYAPLGGLMVLAALRVGRRQWPAWLVAVLLPTGLSYGMEVTQHFLPGRYPSILDWALNTGGATLGATLGLLLHRMGWLAGWDRIRDRWFDRRSAGALALLALWPLGLLFPAPFPLGLGLGWPRVQSAGVDWLLDVPWAQRGLEWWIAIPAPTEPLPRLLEGAGVMLGLVGPCLLAFSVMSPGSRRLLLACAMGLAATLAASTSAALNFGPQHALAWATPVVAPAGLTAFGLLLLLSAVPPRVAAVLSTLALLGLMVLVAVTPLDGYFAQSLQAWEQGRFVRFHGLAQWVGWLWPWAAVVWLAGRLRGESGAATWPKQAAAYNPSP